MKFAKLWLILSTIDRFWWILQGFVQRIEKNHGKMSEKHVETYKGKECSLPERFSLRFASRMSQFRCPFFDSHSLWSWAKNTSTFGTIFMKKWMWARALRDDTKNSCGADYFSQLLSFIWSHTYSMGDLQVFNAGPSDGSDDCSDECCPQADNNSYIVYFLSQGRLCAPVTRRSTLACFLIRD